MACVALLVASTAVGQPFLLPLGQPSGFSDWAWSPAVMPGNGGSVFATFYGGGTFTTYRWWPGGGFVPVPAHGAYLGTRVTASSADGSRFVGDIMQHMSPVATVAAVWRQGMGGAPELAAPGVWSLNAISRDGSTWGGVDTAIAIYREGVRTVLAQGSGEVRALSADGSVAAGYGEPPTGSGLGSAFVWREGVGMTFLAPVPGFTADYVYGLTAAGGAALGISVLRNAAGQVVDTGLWTWSSAGGRVRLEDPRPDLRPVWPQITGDGSVVSSIFTPRSGSGASESHLHFTAAREWVRFEDHLGRFGLSTEGWQGFRVSGISDDGLAFTGTAYYQGVYQHFYARVPGAVTMATLALAGLAAWGSRRRRPR